jgi:Ca2+-binding RTX toxin-like protein
MRRTSRRPENCRRLAVEQLEPRLPLAYSAAPSQWGGGWLLEIELNDETGLLTIAADEQGYVVVNNKRVELPEPYEGQLLAAVTLRIEVEGDTSGDIDLSAVNEVAFANFQGAVVEAGDPQGQPITITGTPKNDSLRGKSANASYTIHGLGGDDIIEGRDGDDNLFGDEGNDTIYGGDGHDTIDGGLGDDVLMGEKGNDQVLGFNGNDWVFGDSAQRMGNVWQPLESQHDGNDTLEGGAGDDKLYGSGGSDEIDGNADIDDLYGGTGNDTLDGGSAHDYLAGQAGDDTLKSGGGGNPMWQEYNWLYGGDGDDILLGESGDATWFDGGANAQNGDIINALDQDGDDWIQVDIGDLQVWHDWNDSLVP